MFPDPSLPRGPQLASPVAIHSKVPASNRRERTVVRHRPGAVQRPDPAEVRVVDRYARAVEALAGRTRSAAPLNWR
jgi:hypothetical protein